MSKTPEQIALMAESGRLLASVFGYLDRLDLLGMSTLQVNDLVDKYIVEELKARPASKGQYGFAYAMNTSRNEVVCHGVPSANEILRDGDLVNFDITLEKNGYIADSSKTYLIGEVTDQARQLVRVTYEAMCEGIAAVRPGAASAISAMPSNGTLAPTAIRWFATTAATVLAGKCTSHPKCCTGAKPAPA